MFVSAKRMSKTTEQLKRLTEIICNQSCKWHNRDLQLQKDPTLTINNSFTANGFIRLYVSKWPTHFKRVGRSKMIHPLRKREAFNVPFRRCPRNLSFSELGFIASLTWSTPDGCGSGYSNNAGFVIRRAEISRLDS